MSTIHDRESARHVPSSEQPVVPQGTGGPNAFVTSLWGEDGQPSDWPLPACGGRGNHPHALSIRRLCALTPRFKPAWPVHAVRSTAAGPHMKVGNPPANRTEGTRRDE